MFELILTVCLMGQPAYCKEERVALAERSGLTGCIWEGQLRAVDWVRDHPDWQIKRWTCDMPKA